MSLLTAPPGWSIARLGDICDIQGGGQPPKSEFEYTQKPGYVRFLQIRDFGEKPVPTYIRREQAPKYCDSEDVLIARYGASLGRIVTGQAGAYNVALAKIVFDRSKLWSRYIFYLFQTAHFQTPIHMISRSAQNGFNKSDVFPICLPIAPRNEQQRVAEVLDLFYSRLDAAVASLERAQTKLRAYRASVLKAAVEGRLVPTEAELARREGRDYEPASVLLARILKERRRRWEEAELARMKKAGRSPNDDKWKAKYEEPEAPDTRKLPSLPEGWCWASVDAVLAAIETGKNFACDERPPGLGEVGVVKVSAVTWGTFDENESKTCTRPELIDNNIFIGPGDFLFSRANTIELVGACVITGAFSRVLMLSDKILRLRLLGGLERWMLWCLRSPWGRREIESLATGNQESMRNLAQASLRRISIPLPPAAESDRIVDEVEQRLSVTTEAEAQSLRDVARCGRLRQSILKWAFEGKLVDQDPYDEPAEELLARIRAERAAAPTTKTRGRKAKSS